METGYGPRPTGPNYNTCYFLRCPRETCDWYVVWLYGEDGQGESARHIEGHIAEDEASDGMLAEATSEEIAQLHQAIDEHLHETFESSISVAEMRKRADESRERYQRRSL